MSSKSFIAGIVGAALLAFAVVGAVWAQARPGIVIYAHGQTWRSIDIVTMGPGPDGAANLIFVTTDNRLVTCFAAGCIEAPRDESDRGGLPGGSL